MASYLRPRRGKKATAESRAVVLKKGEVFFEIGANGISTGSSAKACGKIKMGDGSTTYSNLGYFIDVDTSVIAFTNTATATAAAQGNDYYSQLNAIAPTATVKSIFGNVKSLLYKMATNLTELNNDTGGQWINAGQAGGTTRVLTTLYGFNNITGIYVLLINSSGVVLDSKIISDKFAIDIMGELAGSGQGAISVTYGGDNYGEAWLKANQISVYTSANTINIRVYVRVDN